MEDQKAAQSSVVRDLADAVSMQARAANRAWLALMAAAIVVIVPRPPEAKPDAGVPLPLGLGQVASEWFYPLAFLVLAILTIAFCSAHAQQVRAAKLAQRAIDPLGNTTSVRVHPRDLFDLLRLPSINRVAPLAQLLRGRYQFHPEAGKCPAGLRRLSATWYLALKVVAVFVSFGLPAAALLHAYRLVRVDAPWSWLVSVIGAVAAGTLLQVVIVDSAYVWRVTGIIGGKK